MSSIRFRDLLSIFTAKVIRLQQHLKKKKNWLNRRSKILLSPWARVSMLSPWAIACIFNRTRKLNKLSLRKAKAKVRLKQCNRLRLKKSRTYRLLKDLLLKKLMSPWSRKKRKKATGKVWEMNWLTLRTLFQLHQLRLLLNKIKQLLIRLLRLKRKGLKRRPKSSL